ncbi:MAG: helix-turn-helix transcriptional regulator [Bacteroidetes bacterium]|nr:helix-turn-helix transcriptional regulator [Bacteroidota bacterium]
MKIYIQHMVSLRCKLMVKSELEKLKIKFSNIELGEIELDGVLSHSKHDLLQKALRKSGLELMDDNKAILIEKIRNIIVEMIHYEEEAPRVKFSDYLSEKLHVDYNTLSVIFSLTKGITIEHYIILHKIERAKELLIYDQLSIKEIAYKLNYSSAAHLSNQFKKTTGFTPSFFKGIKGIRRKNLEDL